MKKLARLIIGIIVIMGGLGVCIFSVPLVLNMTDWGNIFTLLIPSVLFAIALLAIGWGIIQNVRWRDIFESILSNWY